MSELRRGAPFSLSFENKEVRWLLKHLGKDIELECCMGFNKKYRGKTRVHILEVSFNNCGRFLRISEFASHRKMTFLIIPKGERTGDLILNGGTTKEVKALKKGNFVLPFLARWAL